MQWQLSPSVIIEAVVALGLLIVAIYFPWRDLNRSASRTGSMLLIFAALWILTHSLEIGTPVASYKAYLMGLQLIWGLIALTLWLIYILQYIDPGKWQTVRIYALFGIMPLLAIVALTTNHIYGLMWTAPGLNIANPYLPLDPVYGLFYWFSMVYMAILIVYGSFLIVKKVVNQNNFRRWEPWVLILAATTPLLAAFLEVTGVTMSANFTIGITPFFSGIGVIALVWTLPRFHLQKVIPIARQTVFEQIGDCVVVLNMQNRIVDMNPAAEHLAGYKSLEALGLPVEQIWPNWPSQMMLSEMGSMMRGELVLKSAAEQNIYDLRVYAVTDDKNYPTNKVALLTDVTEHKKAEEEQRRLRDKAEMSSRLAAVGEMAAGIAHEINNPLTSVIGFSELLLLENLPPNIKEQLKIIADGSQRVKEIIRRMLTFARQVKPMKTAASVNELIEATLDLRSYVLRTANIEVAKHLAPDLPCAMVDLGQMQQVFLNLIVNAEYAMKKTYGKGTLTVTTKKEDSHINISFTDDGPGISPEVKANLFNPFFTTKEDGEGTGLGLSLSRSIILEHGGTIEVESEPGEGANFLIMLPVTPSAEGATAEALVAAAATSPEKGRAARILMVDDEESIRKLASKILVQSGHSVDDTGEPVEALLKLNNTSYDIILLDIRMPGMSGMELYAKIIEKYPELTKRVIFITGDTSAGDTKAYLEQNNLSYIAKPFDREVLLQKVQSLL